MSRVRYTKSSHFCAIGTFAAWESPRGGSTVFSKDVLTLTLILTLGLAANAEAYMDPGTGALIWQTLLAAAVGFGFYFRRVLSWFKRDKDS